MKPALCLLLVCLLPLLAGAQVRMKKKLFTHGRHGGLTYHYIDVPVDNLMLVRNAAGKYGFVDSLFNEKIPCIYDYAQRFGNGRAAVMMAGKCGLIDTLGNMLIPCVYTSITQNHTSLSESEMWTSGIDRYVIVKDDSTTRIYDLVTNKATIPEYRINERQYFNADRYMAVRSGRHYGLGDESGKWVVPAIYDHITLPKGGYRRFACNRKKGFFNASLKPITGCIFNDAHDFSEGLAAVQANGEWGYIDTTGQIAVAPCYTYAEEFSNGVAVVMFGGKYGAINKTGKQVIPFVYDFISSRIGTGLTYKNHLIGSILAVRQNNKWALIDTGGRFLTSFRYDSVWDDDHGLKVKEGSRYRLIVSLPADTTSPLYDELVKHYHKFTFTLARLGDKWTVLDSVYRPLHPLTFSSQNEAREEMHNIAAHWRKGQLLPGNEYNYVAYSDFYRGRATVRNVAGMEGAIDKRGRQVIPCRFRDVGVFANRTSIAITHDEEGVVDRKGRFTPYPFIHMRHLHGRWYSVYKGEKAGVTDKQGNEVIPYIYDGIEWIGHRKLLVSVGDAYGVINCKGDTILPVADALGYGVMNRALILVHDDSVFIRNRHLKVKAIIDPALSIDWHFKRYGYGSGLLAVRDSNGKWGYVSKRGKLKIPCIFDDAARFHDGRAVVSVLHKYTTGAYAGSDSITLQGTINKRGRVAIPPQYAYIGTYIRHMPVKVKLHGYDKYGLADKRGRLIAPHMYEEMAEYYPYTKHGWLFVHRDSTGHYIDKKARTRLLIRKMQSRPALYQ